MPQTRINTRFANLFCLLKLVSQEINFSVFNSVFATFVTIFAIFAGIILIDIKIVLKMHSCIKPIIYSDIQKLSLVIAFVPEFFYQLLKSFHGHSTIHFAPIFLLKQQHFMY